MSAKRDGGQAYPIPGDEEQNRVYGKSLRDSFAEHALMGFCANSFADIDPAVAANASFKIADAMLDARERPEKIGDAASVMLAALEQVRGRVDGVLGFEVLWAVVDSAIRVAKVAGVKIQENKGEVGP